VATGAGDIGSLSAVGVKLNRDGQIDFDKAKFLDALKNDPEKTRSYFDSYTNVAHANAKATAFDPGWDDAKGLARKLQTISQIATRGVRLPTDPADAPALEGTIPGMIKRKNDLIANLNDQVDRWDARLETRRAALTRQFSALEVALGKMQQQSSWLSGQIAGLPSYS
jgi:flagellar hook-associated protein 2